MNRPFLIILFSIFSVIGVEAYQALPFKAAEIKIDFGQKRSATFKYDGMKDQFSSDHHTLPKVEGIKFTFSDGKIANVPSTVFQKMQILDPSMAMIESGPAEGQWFLSVRIKNTENIADRVANDWVVFVFTNYKYEKFWLERNENRKATITKAEKAARNPQAPDAKVKKAAK